jgi:AraC family transcriptional regulator
MQSVLAWAATHLDEDISLTALAGRAGLSAFHLHRLFATVIGETPKGLTSRLRLERAAVMLLLSGKSVLDIALSCGFQSHEVFIRAFRRRFGIAPRAYRARGFAAGVKMPDARNHATLVSQVGPCVGLYHISENGRSRKDEMTYSITKKELAPQPVLVMRRRVKRSEIAQTIGEMLPKIFLYAQQNGIALTGLPFTRYPESAWGLMTIEPGMRIATPVGTLHPGDAEVQADTLPGGPAAVAMHAGPYETLPDAYAAIQLWIEAEGLVAAGAPWESYITDPGDYPDPKDWKTEVFWPLAS